MDTKCFLSLTFHLKIQPQHSSIKLPHFEGISIKLLHRTKKGQQKLNFNKGISN